MTGYWTQLLIAYSIYEPEMLLVTHTKKILVQIHSFKCPHPWSKNHMQLKKMFCTILTCFCLFKSGWGVISRCRVCLVCGISVCLVCGISVCLAGGIKVCPTRGICRLRPGSKLWKHLHVAPLFFHPRTMHFSRIFKVFSRLKFMKAGFVPFRSKVNTEYI